MKCFGTYIQAQIFIYNFSWIFIYCGKVKFYTRQVYLIVTEM